MQKRQRKLALWVWARTVLYDVRVERVGQMDDAKWTTRRPLTDWIAPTPTHAMRHKPAVRGVPDRISLRGL